ncbi:MAG: hypothetical protein GXO32_08080 [Crenarchaeota archaeon]|nr:hypothetical protein [Thermoproteota archaeon]
MSYRCLVYVVNDMSKVGSTFAKEVRDAQLSAHRGVIAVFRASRISDVIPQVRDTLLNNVAMGIVILTIDDYRPQLLRRALEKFASRKTISDAKIIFEESLSGVAEELSHIFREWSVAVDLVKV